MGVSFSVRCFVCGLVGGVSAYPSSPTTSTGGWRRGEDTTTTSAEETTTAPEHEPEPTKPKTTKPEPEPKPDPAAELKNAIKDRLGDSNRDVHRITVKAAAKAGKPINVKVAILKGGRRGRRLEVQGRRGPWHVFDGRRLRRREGEPSRVRPVQP
jgi:hypothetical protein